MNLRRARRTSPGILSLLFSIGSTLVALSAGLWMYARKIEPRWLDVKHLRLRLPRLAPEFDGYRIAQFSDLHMEKWCDWEMLDRVIDETNAFQPDLVVITGDFVHDDISPVADRLTAALARLKPGEATLGILGNHDHWIDCTAVCRVMARADITNISNEVYTVRRGDAALHIAGLDSLAEFRARFDVVLRCLPDEGAAILLVHEPDFAFISAPTRRFDLQLSGHSHGGQVRVPVLMDMVLPSFSSNFLRGLRRVKGMYVYTNRGLGVSGLRLRFRSRPELTLFTLRSGAQ